MKRTRGRSEVMDGTFSLSPEKIHKSRTWWHYQGKWREPQKSTSSVRSNFHNVAMPCWFQSEDQTSAAWAFFPRLWTVHSNQILWFCDLFLGRCEFPGRSLRNPHFRGLEFAHPRIQQFKSSESWPVHFCHVTTKHSGGMNRSAVSQERDVNFHRDVFRRSDSSSVRSSRMWDFPGRKFDGFDRFGFEIRGKIFFQVRRQIDFVNSRFGSKD